MARQNNRVSDPGAPSPWALLSLMGLLLLAMFNAWTALNLGHRLAGTAGQLPAGFTEQMRALVRGNLGWPPAGWYLFGGLFFLELSLVGWLATRFWRRNSTKKTRVDRAAKHMGVGRDVEAITEKNVRATARRLGVPDEAAPGVPIGRHLASGRPLFGSWEDMHVDIWGPRTGKTTSRAVPAILDAPGACMVTSNKRDVADATRGARADHGEVWVFDPQGIAQEEPSWWWNPLTYVTDEVKAAELAEHFASGSRESGAKTDSYFEPAGQDLLADMLLAAALDGRPITDVYLWLTDSSEREPVRILTKAGYDLNAARLHGVISLTERQRDGVFGSAKQMATCLTNRQTLRWVTDDGHSRRPHFDPAAFVVGRNTLYSLSKEGKGSAGPLVTALTVAVCTAADELAVRSPGGRLRTPVLGVLDEAANVCRWRNLPSLYSYYGSKGIVLMTILQSWSQGCDVWGESGMKKLWSAANVKVYGGGVAETGFLEDLSKLVGEHERVRSSLSTGTAHKSISHSVQRERTLDVADLGALPKGRAVVLASGSRATLVRTSPWMTGPHADAVRASILEFDPKGEATIAAAQRELALVTANLEEVPA